MLKKKTPLYPLKFIPIYKEKLWGGNRIACCTKDSIIANKKIGEMYSISGLEGDCSIVANGPLAGKTINELLWEYQEDLLGASAYTKYSKKFPLLMKVIDAADDLSIQVHPDDALADKNHKQNGKSEMWYILDSEEGSSIISGFKNPTTAEDVKFHICKNTLIPELNKVKTNKDDCYYIPAGKIHTIGKGNLIAEVQQTSDLTYRVYDFDRIDSEGARRELHLDRALKALDYQGVDSGCCNLSLEGSFLMTEHFSVVKLAGDKTIEKTKARSNSFVVLFNVGEPFQLRYAEEEIAVNSFETVLLPPNIKDYTLSTTKRLKVLETFLT